MEGQMQNDKKKLPNVFNNFGTPFHSTELHEG